MYSISCRGAGMKLPPPPAFVVCCPGWFIADVNEKAVVVEARDSRVMCDTHVSHVTGARHQAVLDSLHRDAIETRRSECSKLEFFRFGPD